MQQERNSTIRIKELAYLCIITLEISFLITFLTSCSDNKEIRIGESSYQESEKRTQRTSEISKGDKTSWNEIDNPSKDGWNTEKLAHTAEEGLNEIKKTIFLSMSAEIPPQGLPPE